MTREVYEAVVLAGGFGTRLAHIVPDVCKPMAPVSGRPFLRYVLDTLSAAKFERIVIADGYRREQIESYFGGSYRGMEIIYSPENEPLGTGGAARRALQHCEGDAAFVLNGDTWLDCDFAAMERALAGDTEVVLAVKRMRGFDRYGTVEVDRGGLVSTFNEKRPCEDGLINAGVYLVQAAALANMPESFSLEKEWLEPLAGTGGIYAVECDGDFIDIGVPEDYEYAQSMLAPFSHGWRLAIFDRDGTINVDTIHLHEPDRLELIPETVELLRRYTEDSDYKVVVATNQAGIAKGLYTEREMRAVHRALDSMLEERGCYVDAYYHCPHHPDFTGPCACRKPGPGMLLAAMHDFDARPDDCVMYGDKDSDLIAAEAAGVRFEWVAGCPSPLDLDYRKRVLTCMPSQKDS